MPQEDIIEAMQNFSFGMMHLREEMMKSQKLSFTDVFLISYIRKFGPTRPSDLATLMGLTKPTITHIIDGLETRNFVRRKFGEEDRRTIFVHVGENAEKMFQEFDTFQDDFKNALGNLDENAIESIVSVINRLISVITKKIKEAKNEQ